MMLERKCGWGPSASGVTRWIFSVIWSLSTPAHAQYLSQLDLVDSFNAFWYDLFGTVEQGDLTATVAVATDENFEEVLEDSKDKTWILQFYAPWCKHCQQYAPMYLEAAERVPGLRFAKMDATAHAVTAETYDVTGSLLLECSKRCASYFSLSASPNSGGPQGTQR
eukprot:SAG11_NODE_149_length_14661_cov_10.031658_1_plen_166_part_00